MGIDEAAVAEVLVALHPLEELIARQHHPGVVGELTQQAELGLGQVQLHPGLQRDALGAAHFDVAESASRRDGCVLVQLHPTQRGTLLTSMAMRWRECYRASWRCWRILRNSLSEERRSSAALANWPTMI